MKTTLPAPFPDIDVSRDCNPAIRLFGKRFIKEQSLVEYLVEFLALIYSNKSIGDTPVDNPFPSIETLDGWPKGERLKYSLPIKLNLKLFSFLSGSRLDHRHAVHKNHYESLLAELEKRVSVFDESKENVIEHIEQFLRSYHGAGGNRSWCAKTFFPISSSLITQETIWNVSAAKRENPEDWYQTLAPLSKYYSTSKRDYMARGGETLYLQLCNLFIIDPVDTNAFAAEMGFIDGETDLVRLHGFLQQRLPVLDKGHTEVFDKLVHFIDSLDVRTQELTSIGEGRIACEWCPRESWPEAYLFAVELSRLLKAALDPIERLSLLATGCVLQVMRSLCAQSSRYSIGGKSEKGSVLGYSWLFSHLGNPTQQERIASQRNLEVVQTLIQRALRNNALLENTRNCPSTKKSEKNLYREADTKYGHKLLLSLGKKMEIIAPSRGPGARFVMTDKLLRFLVIVLLRPGERITYGEFLQRLYQHYGIAVEGEALTKSLTWSNLPSNAIVQSNKDSWFATMLRAGGFLTELSDACSIVCNTFGKGG